MRMRALDHQNLVRLNLSSIAAGRSQHLDPEHMPARPPDDRYLITYHNVRDHDGRREIRVCIVFDLFTGQTAWLDVSRDEFAAMPEADVSIWDWETAMCAGTPPQAP